MFDESIINEMTIHSYMRKCLMNKIIHLLSMRSWISPWPRIDSELILLRWCYWNEKSTPKNCINHRCVFSVLFYRFLNIFKLPGHESARRGNEIGGRTFDRRNTHIETSYFAVNRWVFVMNNVYFLKVWKHLNGIQNGFLKEYMSKHRNFSYLFFSAVIVVVNDENDNSKEEVGKQEKKRKTDACNRISSSSDIGSASGKMKIEIRFP